MILYVAILLGLSKVAPSSDGVLMAGVARVDITPPMQMKASLGGYGDRMNKPATGIHDRVWAKALTLRLGTKRFTVVTADILGFPPGFKSAVLAKLGSPSPLNEELMLLPSHSHTSIDMSSINPKNTFGIPQIGVFHLALYDRTVKLVGEVISASSRKLQPCTVGTESVILTGWTHNRREGNKKVQPDLTVTRIDGDQAPLAVLVNWTAHPTFMDENDMMFSGDWPGHMQRTVEALVGSNVTVMYYNGAQGDQAPTARPGASDNWEKAERYGRELGIRVWKLWQSVQPDRSSVLAFHLEQIPLPKRTWHPDFLKTGGAEYGLTKENIGPVIEQLSPPATHSISLRVGSLVIAGVPGELAATLGDEVKSRIRVSLGVKHVVIGGLADEWISYMLAPEEYRKGGYEASVSFYGERLGPVIVAGVIRCAARLGTPGRLAH